MPGTALALGLSALLGSSAPDIHGFPLPRDPRSEAAVSQAPDCPEAGQLQEAERAREAGEALTGAEEEVLRRCRGRGAQPRGRTPSAAGPDGAGPVDLAMDSPSPGAQPATLYARNRVGQIAALDVAGQFGTMADGSLGAAAPEAVVVPASLAGKGFSKVGDLLFPSYRKAAREAAERRLWTEPTAGLAPAAARELTDLARTHAARSHDKWFKVKKAQHEQAVAGGTASGEFTRSKTLLDPKTKQLVEVKISVPFEDLPAALREDNVKALAHALRLVRDRFESGAALNSGEWMRDAARQLNGAFVARRDALGIPVPDLQRGLQRYYGMSAAQILREGGEPLLKSVRQEIGYDYDLLRKASSYYLPRLLGDGLTATLEGGARVRRLRPSELDLIPDGLTLTSVSGRQAVLGPEIREEILKLGAPRGSLLWGLRVE